MTIRLIRDPRTHSVTHAVRKTVSPKGLRDRGCEFKEETRRVTSLSRSDDSVHRASLVRSTPRIASSRLDHSKRRNSDGQLQPDQRQRPSHPEHEYQRPTDRGPDHSTGRSRSPTFGLRLDTQPPDRPLRLDRFRPQSARRRPQERHRLQWPTRTNVWTRLLRQGLRRRRHPQFLALHR